MWGTPSVVRRMVAWNCPSATAEPSGGVALFDPLQQPSTKRPTTTVASNVRVRLDPNEAPSIDLTRVCHGRRLPPSRPPHPPPPPAPPPPPSPLPPPPPPPPPPPSPLPPPPPPPPSGGGRREHAPRPPVTPACTRTSPVLPRPEARRAGGRVRR